MKITRAQKEAVISLLKEKFEERNKEIKQAYIKEHFLELEKKVDPYLALQEEVKQLLTRVKEIASIVKESKPSKEGDISFDRIRADYNIYYDPKNAKCVLYHEFTKDELIKSVFVNKVEEPDYNRVSRELELAGLSQDFDLNAFLDKYLPK
jgi:hypothetical protein